VNGVRGPCAYATEVVKLAILKIARAVRRRIAISIVADKSES
jgi:hypothetical protein